MKSPTLGQPAGLISVLRDQAAEHGDRVDAAMDLAAFSEPEVESVLLEVALNLAEDADIADQAGHSLWEVWSRTGRADAALIGRMHPAAQRIFRNARA